MRLLLLFSLLLTVFGSRLRLNQSLELFSELVEQIVINGDEKGNWATQVELKAVGKRGLGIFAARDMSEGEYVFELTPGWRVNCALAERFVPPSLHRDLRPRRAGGIP